MNNTTTTQHRLVDSFWVDTHLDDANVHFIEIGCSAISDFLQLHLSNAAYLDIDVFEGGRFWNVHSPDHIFRHLNRHFPSRQVREMMLGTTVLYGMDQSCVCRAAIILISLGFRRIHVVDGGKTKLITDRVPMTRTITSMLCSEPTVARPQPAPKLHFSHEELANLDMNRYDLISIRSQEEFDGVISGYSYFDKKGRIPGSIHGQDIDYYRNQDQTVIDYRRIIDALDLDNGRPKIFYCGTGWRASEVAFYVLTLGYECYVYDGGWYEWSYIEH